MRLVGTLVLLGALSYAAEIKRLDGSSISTDQAETIARTALDKAGVKGAQIAVLNNGALVWSYAYGIRDKEGRPFTKETTTWAASITKSLFSTYVMQLVAKGEFSLDTPISQLLPMDVPFTSDLVKDPRWAKVTSRMLLSHTSGLANFSFLEPDKKMHLHAEPGSRYSYSGDGINLVQLAVEKLKGKPLDQLMNDSLFGPHGMTRTSLVFRKDFEADIADRFDETGKFIGQTRRSPARAAGSATTSAEDLARFASALMEGKIVSLGSLLKPEIQIDAAHQFPARPDGPKGAEGPAVGLAYGIGWGLLTRTPFGPAFFKEGHGDGAQDYMICFQRSKSCMILLTNSDNGEKAFQLLLETILRDTVTPWEWEGYAQTGSYHVVMDNDSLAAVWTPGSGLLIHSQPHLPFKRQITLEGNTISVSIENAGDFIEEIPLWTLTRPEKLGKDRLPLADNAQLETDSQSMEIVRTGESYVVKLVARDKLQYRIRFAKP